MNKTIIAIALVITARASGYTLEGGAFLDGNVRFEIKLGPFDSVAEKELAEWDKYTNTVHLIPVEITTNNFALGDGHNSIVWSADAPNLNLNLHGALAVCFPQFFNPVNGGDGVMHEADIVFNSAFTWSSYDGPLNSTYDIGRVLLHELGHAIGLEHSTYSDSIMYPIIHNQWQLSADDIAGATAIYGSRTRNVPDAGDTAGMLAFSFLGLATINLWRRIRY
jgi:Matrixin